MAAKSAGHSIAAETPPVYAAPRGATAAGIIFSDVTQASGIDYTHVNGAFGEKWMPETMGSGVVTAKLCYGESSTL